MSDSSQSMTLRVTGDTSGLSSSLRSVTGELNTFADRSREVNDVMTRDARRASTEIRTAFSRPAALRLSTDAASAPAEARAARELVQGSLDPVTLAITVNGEQISLGLAQAQNQIASAAEQTANGPGLFSGLIEATRADEESLAGTAVRMAATVSKIAFAIKVYRNASAIQSATVAAGETAFATAARFVPQTVAITTFAAIVNGARSTTREIVELNRAATRAGTDIVGLRTALGAFETSGVRDATATLAHFREQLKQARDDQEGDSAKRFQELGLGGAQLAGTSQDAALRATVEALRRVEDSSDRARLAQHLFGEESARTADLIRRGGAGVDRARVREEFAAPSRATIQAAQEAEAQWKETGEFIRGILDELASWVNTAWSAAIASSFRSVATTISHDFSTLGVTVARGLTRAADATARFLLGNPDTSDNTPTIGTRRITVAEQRADQAIDTRRERLTPDRAILEEARLAGLIRSTATDERDLVREIAEERRRAAGLTGPASRGEQDAAQRELDAVKELVRERRRLQEAMEAEGTAESVRIERIQRLESTHLEEMAALRARAAQDAMAAARADLESILTRTRAEDTLRDRAESLGLVRANATREELAGVADLVEAFERAQRAAESVGATWAATDWDGNFVVPTPQQQAQPSPASQVMQTPQAVTPQQQAAPLPATATPTTATQQVAADLAAVQQVAERRRQLAERQTIEAAERGLEFRRLVELEGLSIARANERLAVERGLTQETARRVREIAEEEEALTRRRTLIDGQRTPLGGFQEAQQQIADLGRRGLITFAQEGAAMAQQFLALERSLGSSRQSFQVDVIDPRTLEGARFGAQQRLQTQAGSTDPQERIRRVLEAQTEIERRNNAELQAIGRALRNAPPLRPANLPNN